MHTLLNWALAAALALSSNPSVNSTQLLETSTTWNGAPIHYSAASQPEVQAVLVEIAPGSATAWHQHPVNNFAYMLQGRIRLELEDGTQREFGAGDAFAEVVNTWHRGVNVGTGPVKILLWYMADTGTPVSVPRPAAKQ